MSVCMPSLVRMALLALQLLLVAGLNASLNASLNAGPACEYAWRGPDLRL